MGGSIAWVRPELADGGRGHQPGETAGFSELSWPVMGVLKILPWWFNKEKWWFNGF